MISKGAQGIVGLIVTRDTDYAVSILTDCDMVLRQAGLMKEANLLDEALDRILEARALLKGYERNERG